MVLLCIVCVSKALVSRVEEPLGSTATTGASTRVATLPDSARGYSCLILFDQSLFIDIDSIVTPASERDTGIDR